MLLDTWKLIAMNSLHVQGRQCSTHYAADRPKYGRKEHAAASGLLRCHPCPDRLPSPR